MSAAKRTPLSGPEMVALSKRHTMTEWSAQAAANPIPIARAKGSWFWTPEEEKFLDFNSQLMCTNIGHGDERVLKAITDQAATLAYANPFMATEPRARLGAKLAEICPGDIDAFFFTNGGAEAVENAFRIARLYTGRHKIAARYRSYHGGTSGALSATGDPRRWFAEPGMPGIFRIPDFHEFGAAEPRPVAEVLAETEKIIRFEGPHTVAAIIVEPVVGTNGILIPPDGYMQGLRDICDRHGILLIADEVQTGFARTGKMFAMEHFGVSPDLMTMAKSMAGGTTLSAVSGKAAIMDGPAPGGLGGTYAGNPLAIAASHAVLDVMAEERLPERAQKLGDQLIGHLIAQRAVYPQRMGDVRGLGAMVACEFIDAKGAPDADTTKKVQTAALKRGLLLLTCGVYGNVIRFLFPLTIEDSVFAEGLAKFDAALAEVLA